MAIKAAGRRKAKRRLERASGGRGAAVIASSVRLSSPLLSSPSPSLPGADLDRGGAAAAMAMGWSVKSAFLIVCRVVDFSARFESRGFYVLGRRTQFNL